MKIKFADLIWPKGTIGRSEYIFWGIVLFTVKYNIDRLIARYFFARDWGVWEYLFPRSRNLPTAENRVFFTALVIAALPFIWSGCVLTIRRLRSAGLPVWLVVLFFVPVLNLFLFAILFILPPAENRVHVTRKNLAWRLSDLIPKGRFGSALLAVVLSGISAIAFTRFSVHTLNQYGWGLFVGLPFCLGLTSSLIYSYHQERKWGECVLVALLAISIAGGCLFLVAFEGMICIFMSAPLMAVLALIGATIGHLLQFQPGSEDKIYCVSNLLVIAIMAVQSTAEPKPALFSVTTTMEIQAPAQTVWKNVVSFSELPPPRRNDFPRRNRLPNTR